MQSITKKYWTILILMGCWLLLIAGCSGGSAPVPLTNAEVRAIAKDAYVYSFPMLEIYRTGSKRFGVDTGFTHFRTLYTSANRKVIKPNNDTLYSTMYLDLRAEPYILEVPAIADRYYSFELIDQYTLVPAMIGTRATGTGAGKYLIAGPDWTEAAVPGITKVIKIETNFVLILGRTAVNGPTDLAAANAVQDQYKMTSLSTYSGIPKPTVPALTFPVVDAEYPANFTLTIWNLPGIPALNTSLPGNPPYKETSAAFISYVNFLLGRVKLAVSESGKLATFRLIGIGPDLPFNTSDLNEDTLYAINAGISDAKAEISNVINSYPTKNGWSNSLDFFGTRAEMGNRYSTRAYAALSGLYGMPSYEAIYPQSKVDSTGLVYDGGHSYTVTFPAGQLPPLKELGFWSLTIYDAEGFLVDNPLNRYSIGSLAKGYTLNPDGSLTIYIQSTQPSDDKLSNWLPAPAAGSFSLALRLYLPDESAVKGSWLPPGVVRVN